MFQDGEKRLSEGALAAITLMIAESKAEEKDVMVKLMMNYAEIIVIICNCKSDLVEERGTEYN